MLVLGIDPGKNPNTFAYSLYFVTFDETEYDITKTVLLHSRFFEYPIQNMETSEINRFRVEIQCLFEYLNLEKGDMVVSELYFQRGVVRKGNSSAYVNMMLGIIASVCFDMSIDYVFYHPSTWKSRFKKEFGMPADEYFPTYNGLDSHRADSSGQAQTFLMKRHDDYLHLKKREEIDARKALRAHKAEVRRQMKEQRKKEREEMRKAKDAKKG
jgi:hypothetical protein